MFRNNLIFEPPGRNLILGLTRRREGAEEGAEQIKRESKPERTEEAEVPGTVAQRRAPPERHRWRLRKANG